MKNEEIWTNIKDYEGLYQISSYGRVKSLRRKRSDNIWTKTRILKNRTDKYGYSHVTLVKNKIYKTCLVHRLVAKAFIPNLNNKPQVNHEDGIKNHNYDYNLKWCTISENNQHAYDMHLKESLKGEENGTSKLKDGDVLQIRKSSLTQKELARIFGVTQTHISRIKRNVSWRHI